jgi:hypothetical protein
MLNVRALAAWAGAGLVLGLITLSCGPSAAPPPTPTQPDPFAVVRATSQAAYASGKAHLDRGEYLQACVDLDTAKTNDPDSSPEIDKALGQALAYCLTPAAEPTSAASAAGTPVARPTVVVATPPAAAPGQTTPAASRSGTATPGAAVSTAQLTPTVAGGAAAAPQGMVMWNDPQGRFAIGAPADWKNDPQPRSLFGTSVVEFRDPSGRGEVDVAVDTNTKAVSPELYAASMELAMQQQVPGYASEQVVPGAAAGNPAVRRVFTFMQKDANGQDHQARGFQVTLVKGSTPYIISGSAPAEQYSQFSSAFDQMVETFRFS